MNPLHLDLFLRLLFWPLDWLYLKLLTPMAQALGGVMFAGMAVTAVAAVVVGGCCFGLLVVGLIGLVQMHERRGKR